MAKTDPTKPYPQRAGLPPLRTSHTRIPRTRTPHTGTRVRATIPATPFTAPLTVPARPQPGRPYRPLQDGFLQGEERCWFEREVGALQRLARTERLLGDYVAAQRLERELDAFITEVSTLVGQERD